MKTIRMTLDAKSIDAGIKELLDYKKLVEEKCEQLRDRVALLIATNARDIFSYAVADDLMGEGYTYGGVDVTVQHDGDITLVIASGKDAIFMEFGAGVYHNGPVGSFANAWGAELGYTIGSYGKGNGAKEVWGYKDGDGFHLTHGTPASMPLFRSVRGVLANIEQIAREVFSA